MSSAHDAYLADVKARIEYYKQELAPLESGDEFSGERQGGGPWVDTTQDRIKEIKDNIGIYESILRNFPRD